jgi:acyl-CoA thioester hydrolase
MAITQAPMKELESMAVIRFQDCDPFGHLNTARYVDYVFNARVDQVEQHYGFRFFERGMQESWLVTKLQIAFLSPAAVMERVLIRTLLVKVTENSLIVEGLMLDHEAERLKAFVCAEFGYVSLVTGKRALHPPELMALFRSVVVEENFDENGFNRRVEELKARYRSPSRP